jgi:hypothetical protein
VIQLNNSVNIAVAAVLFPLLSYVLFYAGPLVGLVYTSKMIDAAPVMRIMVLTCAGGGPRQPLAAAEAGRVHPALNGALLAVAVPLSWRGAHHWGLQRAAGQHGGHLCRAHPAGATPGARDEPAGAPAAWGLLALSATVAVAAGAVSHQRLRWLHLGSLLWTLVVGAVAGLVCYAPYLYW